MKQQLLNDLAELYDTTPDDELLIPFGILTIVVIVSILGWYGITGVAIIELYRFIRNWWKKNRGQYHGEQITHIKL
ncbi:hypothetical protein [Ligilactobacillus sp. 110_WCHN]|uniref:hypothetical protein n=1 Tax=Ligilactobacillus sp. 110_WCHN TaxID=3057125 RepID=UPI0026725594|nr:hypothetical protein [Ligilactobacillus sp. 110_WCHN]MDO3393396.1 hypothetical protein [Ligilactobacillus sp. 110_WCHN]